MASQAQMYTIYLRNQALSASTTNPTFQINLSSSKSLEIYRLQISQNNNTTSGAAEFDLGYGTSTATGTLTQTNINYTKLNPSDPAPGFSLKDGGFTSATGGLTVILRDGFNVLNPFYYIPVPEERPLIRAADGFLSFRLLATPASTNYDVTLVVREIG